MRTSRPGACPPSRPKEISFSRSSSGSRRASRPIARAQISAVSRVRPSGLTTQGSARGVRRATGRAGAAPAAHRLLAAALVERNVVLALQAAFGVPVGLAVADEEETRRAGVGREPAAGHGAQRLCLVERDVGRVGVLHADDVVAGIDVQDLAGDAARQVGEQIDRACRRLPRSSRCGAAASCTRSTSGCSGSRRCRTPPAS